LKPYFFPGACGKFSNILVSAELSAFSFFSGFPLMVPLADPRQTNF
jgi:hypothetical protein